MSYCRAVCPPIRILGDPTPSGEETRISYQDCPQFSECLLLDKFYCCSFRLRVTTGIRGEMLLLTSIKVPNTAYQYILQCFTIECRLVAVN